MRAMRCLGWLVIAACGSGSSPAAAPAPAPPLPLPHAFELAMTMQSTELPAIHRTIVVSSSGKVSDDGAVSSAPQVALDGLAEALRDPALPTLRSIDARGPTTLVTLRASGDIAFELHYPIGRGPSAATALQVQIAAFAARPASPGLIAKLGETCGTIAGIGCTDGLSCDERGCHPEPEGVCVATASACPPDDDPVCACGSQTFRNDCERRLAHATLDHDGGCR